MKKPWTTVKQPVWWCWCIKQKKNKKEIKQPKENNQSNETWYIIKRPLWWCWYFRQKEQ